MRPSGLNDHQMEGKVELTHTALLICRVVMSLGIATHGARKRSGWFVGGGIDANGPYGKGSNDFRLF